MAVALFVLYKRRFIASKSQCLAKSKFGSAHRFKMPGGQRNQGPRGWEALATPLLGNKSIRCLPLPASTSFPGPFCGNEVAPLTNTYTRSSLNALHSRTSSSVTNVNWSTQNSRLREITERVNCPLQWYCDAINRNVGMHERIRSKYEENDWGIDHTSR